jgi:hypothetical protein
VKYGILSNFMPDHALHLNGVLTQRLRRVRASLLQWRSFFKHSELPIRFEYGQMLLDFPKGQLSTRPDEVRNAEHEKRHDQRGALTAT